MKRVLVFCITVAICLCLFEGMTVCAEEKCPYAGSGTQKDPYQITDAETLLTFAQKVNDGETYEDCWFVQTEDIDLKDAKFPAIGTYGGGNYFYGTYDGNGCTIRHLNICSDGNTGFFGVLGGTVMNLGIESGMVSGSCVGAIVSHSCSPKAMVINCYNKAAVTGARAGGIADNFNGTIVNCFSDCKLDAKSNKLGGIVSYTALSLVRCISVEESGRSTVRPEGCQIVLPKKTNAQKLAKQMNKNLFYSAKIMGLDCTTLNLWTVSDNGKSVTFSNEKAVSPEKNEGPAFDETVEKVVVGGILLLALVATAFVMITAQKKTEEAVSVETEPAEKEQPKPETTSKKPKNKSKRK